MGAFRRQAASLIAAAAVGAVAIVLPGVAAPSAVSNVAKCGEGMAPNPAGFGCVPELTNNNNWPGGGFAGAPSQDVVTRCGGNYWICVWPYPTP